MVEAEEIRLRIRVQPRASRNRLELLPDGRIRVSLTAPPVDGAANEALCKFLAEEWGVARRLVQVVAGEKSREKTVSIAAPSPALRELLARRAKPGQDPAAG
jgi:uncharacterized protein